MKEKKKLPKILKIDEEQQLLEWVYHNRSFRDYVVILMILRTGLRTNELRELLVSNISANEEIFTQLQVRAEIAHDKKAREISIPKDLREQLQSYLNWKRQRGEAVEEMSFLFASAKSSQITVRHLQRIIRESTQGALGKPYRSHDLRRTWQARLENDANVGCALHTRTDSDFVGDAHPTKAHRKTDAETTFSDVTSVNDTTPIPPTLVRLSFWVPPERMAEFEAVYQKEIVPFLLRHGLVESSVDNPLAPFNNPPAPLWKGDKGESGRMTVEGAFSRLFEVETLSEIKEKAEALRGDSEWHAMLRSLGATFGVTDTDGRIRYHLHPYIVPAGTGAVVPAGGGRGHWRTFDSSNGLPDNWVHWILQDRDGNLWFATESGACRYDGYRLTTFTTKEGLAHNVVFSVLQDEKGNLWFTTQGGGVSRYDGQNWTTFTQKDGLASNDVWAICEDKDGRLWFGTASFDLKGNGVSCYDGGDWTTFTTKDGLANNNVFSILQDCEGHFWFGTAGGVSRLEPRLDRDGNPDALGYDGKTWTTFTAADGLAHNLVYSILQDQQGHFWFGTADGVSRYDGQNWTTFTTEDGLASNDVLYILQDAEGNFWFCCASGGISRYDGHTFTMLTTEDGLAGNVATFAFQDAEGALWFANAGTSNHDHLYHTGRVGIRLGTNH